jgi:3-phenylpropionate/trans-cinnamate dioxygenase ferredoxin reductase subunit
VPENQPVEGKAGEDSVVVVRKGNEVFAVGANCAHYGVPLAGGIVVGQTIRCPAHHSRFDLATGDLVCAPALSGVGRWGAEVRGGKVFVTSKEPARPPRPPRRNNNLPQRAVIVGGGAAGNAAAGMLRHEGFEGEVTVISADRDAPYDRPNCSKDYLSGEAPEEWMPLHPESFYKDNGINLMTGTTVSSLDIKGKSVTLQNGRAVPYDTLLLATGASPVRLTMPGSNLPHVLTLRTLADSRAIIEKAKTAKRAVVMGASFIGLEVAASLRHRGLEVHIVAPERVPFEKSLGKEIGGAVMRVHEEHGAEFHLGHTAKQISGSSVILDDGSSLSADLVIMGVGVRPIVSLARQAGLAAGNGIEVNDRLETSIPGIYAAGDIANYPDPYSGERARIEHWVVAERQGHVVARNIMGAGERYLSAPFFWTSQYDFKVSYIGHAATWDRVEIDGSPESRDCRVDYFKDGRRIAVAEIGRGREGLEAEAEIEAVLVG